MCITVNVVLCLTGDYPNNRRFNFKVRRPNIWGTGTEHAAMNPADTRRGYIHTPDTFRTNRNTVNRTCRRVNAADGFRLARNAADWRYFYFNATHYNGSTIVIANLSISVRNPSGKSVSGTYARTMQSTGPRSKIDVSKHK